MAINKKLIHFNNKSTFQNELTAGNILDTSIVFIKDSQEIYTHGQFYSKAPSTIFMSLTDLDSTITYEEYLNNLQNASIGSFISLGDGAVSYNFTYVGKIDEYTNLYINLTEYYSPYRGYITYNTSSHYLSNITNFSNVLPIVTESDNGLMLSSDKIKLNSIYSTTSVISLTNIPTTYSRVLVTVSAGGVMTFANSLKPAEGRDIHILVKNSGSSDIEVTLPGTSNEPTLTIPAGKIGEVNVMTISNTMYTKASC